MRLYLLIPLLTLLCAPLPAHSAEDFQGKLIFAVQQLETSEHRIVDGSEYPKERTGLFYYCKESGRGECEPYTLRGYQLENGKAEAAKNNRSFPIPSVTDGAKYRILYDFNGVNIDHTAWNPGFIIKSLAAYSSNLKNLNDLLDLIALDYGRSQLW